MTMGNDMYAKIMRISAEQIKKFYPKSTLFVYDWDKWGLSEKSIDFIKEVGNVEIVKWKVKRLKFRHSLTLKIKNILSIRKFDFSREEKVRQKPYCIQDCIKNHTDRVCFLDGDAFLIRKIDEVMEDDFDTGVTVRGCSELSLNAGIIFFNGNKKTNLQFIDKWIEEMSAYKGIWGDQTSLALLVEKKLEGMKVKFFTVKKYNFYFLKPGIIPHYASILHLKGVLHYSNSWLKKITEQVT